MMLFVYSEVVGVKKKGRLIEVWIEIHVNSKDSTKFSKLFFQNNFSNFADIIPSSKISCLFRWATVVRIDRMRFVSSWFLQISIYIMFLVSFFCMDYCNIGEHQWIHSIRQQQYCDLHRSGALMIYLMAP